MTVADRFEKLYGPDWPDRFKRELGQDWARLILYVSDKPEKWKRITTHRLARLAASYLVQLEVSDTGRPGLLRHYRKLRGWK